MRIKPDDCDEDEPEINEAEMDEIAARIWKRIEIALLAKNEEFLRALEWEIDTE